MDNKILIIIVLITSLSYGQVTTPPDTKKDNNKSTNIHQTIKTLIISYTISKRGVDMGLGFSTGEADIIVNFDFEISNDFWIGAQGNIGLGGDIEGEDYTDTIGTNQFNEDIYELATDSWAIALRVGKEINNKIKIVGALGMAIEYEAQNRYDEFTILGKQWLLSRKNRK